MMTSLGIAALIFVGYVSTLIVVRPNKIIIKLSKKISFTFERNKDSHKEKED